MEDNILSIDNKIIPPKELEIINQVPLKQPKENHKFKSYSLLDLANAPEVDVEWLIPDILPSVGLAQISGTQKSGKSFFLTRGISSMCSVGHLGTSCPISVIQALAEGIGK